MTTPGTGTESFDATTLSKYIETLDGLCGDIVKAIAFADQEINRILQTQTEDSGLYGTAASNLVKVWNDNSEIYTAIEPLLSGWITNLGAICGLKGELTADVAATYQGQEPV